MPIEQTTRSDSALQAWDAISARDKEVAAAYWGNDNPPLELQAAFSRYREEITRETETVFWSLVDREGLSPVPSDMWSAVEALARAARNRDMWKGQSERQAKSLEAWRAASLPSGETKRAYMGEFTFDIDGHYDEESGEVIPRKVDVPWTAIKEIMAVIRERAEFEAGRQ